MIQPSQEYLHSLIGQVSHVDSLLAEAEALPVLEGAKVTVSVARMTRQLNKLANRLGPFDVPATDRQPPATNGCLKRCMPYLAPEPEFLIRLRPLSNTVPAAKGQLQSQPPANACEKAPFHKHQLLRG